MNIFDYNKFVSESVKVRGFYTRASMPELRNIYKLDKEFGDPGADVSSTIHEYDQSLRGSYYFITNDDGKEAKKMIDQASRNVIFRFKYPWNFFSNRLEYPDESKIAKTWLIVHNPDSSTEQISLFYAEIEGTPVLIATEKDFKKLYNHDFSKPLY